MCIVVETVILVHYILTGVVHCGLQSLNMANLFKVLAPVHYLWTVAVLRSSKIPFGPPFKGFSLFTISEL